MGDFVSGWRANWKTRRKRKKHNVVDFFSKKRKRIKDTRQADKPSTGRDAVWKKVTFNLRRCVRKGRRLVVCKTGRFGHMMDGAKFYFGYIMLPVRCCCFPYFVVYTSKARMGIDSTSNFWQQNVEEWTRWPLRELARLLNKDGHLIQTLICIKRERERTPSGWYI